MLLLVSCCIFCIELQIQKYKKCGAAVRPFLNLILLPVGVRVKFEFMNIFNAVLCFLSLNKQIISRILINAGFIFGKLALAKCVTINAKKLDKIGLLQIAYIVSIVHCTVISVTLSQVHIVYKTGILQPSLTLHDYSFQERVA